MQETINERIARFRRYRGFTQQDIADILGVKISTYSQKERRGHIDSDFLIKISEILKIDVKIILYGDETETLITPIHEDMLTHREKDFLKLLRNISPNDRTEIYELIYKKFKNKKNKSKGYSVTEA